MEGTTTKHWKQFLTALAIVALLSVCIDLALGDRLQAASAGCLFIGVVGFQRSLRYHSVRWRALAGIALVLAVTLHIARFAMA
ncbi:MAG: hypothetical protein IPK99_07160 [Flavobacteriales bacterium]|nr:hypothetical protein [Flavobacteriales bacterium]